MFRAMEFVKIEFDGQKQYCLGSYIKAAVPRTHPILIGIKRAWELGIGDFKNFFV